MLEVVIYSPRNYTGTLIDLGSLAELLLFYGKVEVLVGTGEFSDLVRAVGLDNLLHLQDEGLVSVRVLREVLAVNHKHAPGYSNYDFVTVQVSGDKREMSFPSPEELVERCLRRARVGEGLIRRRLARFLRHGSVESVNEGVNLPNGFPDLSRKDVEDPTYVTDLVRAYLDLTGYSHPEGQWHFRIHRNPDGFAIDTNIDFGLLSRLVGARFGDERAVTPAHLMDSVQDVRFELHRGAIHSADIAASELSSRLHRIRIESQHTRDYFGGVPQIATFQQVELQGRSLGDALRSGRRTTDDLLRLLERAQRFREWLAGRPPDANLLREYNAELNRQTWFEGLPGKALRFGLASAVGTLSLDPVGGAAAALATALSDSLIVRLSTGWRPSQFVRDELEPFLR